MPMPRPHRDFSPARPGRLRICTAAALIALLASTGAAAAPRPAPAHLVPVKAAPVPRSAAGLCDRLHFACAGGAGPAQAPEGAMGLAQRINRAVNAEVREISDFGQYGRADVWDLPTRRGGDCEDFALEKKRRLIEAGVPARSLLIATVLDRHRKGHAVLVLRTRSGDFILDNLTSRIVPWHRTGYSFLRMQNPRAPWTWDAIGAGGIFGVTASIAGN